MIVPVPRGGKYNITPVHLDTTTVDRCETAMTFDNESHSEGRVSMGWSYLVWHNKLQSGINSVCCERGFCSE